MRTSRDDAAKLDLRIGPTINDALRANLIDENSQPAQPGRTGRARGPQGESLNPAW
jgi:hypothetical protein